MSNYTHALTLSITPNATTSHTFPSGAVYLLSQVLTQAEANGVTVLVVTSVLSLVSVIGLCVVLALSAFNTRFSSNDQLFVRTHVAFYFASLLACEILQAIGSIMSAKWVRNLEVFVGPFCTSQAIIKQTADVGAATWSFILALHTFLVLFMEWKIKAYVRWLVLIAGWSFIATLNFAGPATVDRFTRGPFHGISGFWCWIAPEYDIQRLTLDYLIIFLSLFFSFALYLLVFLRLRGNIVISGTNVQFRSVANAKKQSWSNHNFQERQVLIIARQMLWYPVAYTVIVFPVAAARFSAFAGHPVPFSVTIFCDVIYLMSGFLNVLLFATTRSVIPKRSILKFVISKPEVQEPDYAEDPDDYYPDMEEGDADKNYSIGASMGISAPSNPRVLDIEKMGASHYDQEALATAKATAGAHPVTPIFRRDSSYHSEAGSELDDYYERKPEAEPVHDHQEEPEEAHHVEPERDIPAQLRPGQSQFQSRSRFAGLVSDPPAAPVVSVPQLQVQMPMPNNALIASRTMLPSPEETENDGDFYDLYEAHSPVPVVTPKTATQQHGQMHDVSLE